MTDTTINAGSGFVKQRGKRWCVVVREPDGKRRWYSGFAKKKDAKAKLTELLGTMQKGAYVEPSKLTVSDYMKQWITAREMHVKAKKIKPATLHGYQKNLRAHVEPSLGALPLQQLAPKHLDAFYNTLLTNGRRDGKGALSTQTVRNVHVLLHGALRDAVRLNHISRNPADLVDAPSSSTAELHTWNVAELRGFLDAMRDDRLTALWTLAATTGARRGELLGLRWKDLDLDAGRLSVRQTLNDIGHKLVIGTPKTDRGTRTMSLDATTVDTLRAHKSRQNAEIMAFGRADWPDHDLVFTREDGDPVHPAWLSRAFSQRVRAAALPMIRFHDLRHTAATLMLLAGVPMKVASERLGHSKIGITADLYTSVLPSLERDAADKLGAIVFGA